MNLLNIFKSKKQKDVMPVLNKITDNQRSIMKRMFMYNVPGAGNSEQTYSTIDLTSLAKTYTNHIWIYACISAIAIAMSSVPLKVFRKVLDKDGKEQKIQLTTKETPQCLVKPSAYCSFSDLIEMMTISLESMGRLFIEKAKTKEGEKVTKELYIVAAQGMKLKTNSVGKITGFRQEINGKSVTDFDVNDIIYTRYYNPMSDVDGMSPIQALWLSLQTDFDAIKYNRFFLKNMSTPNGTLETDQALNDELYNRLLEHWNQSHQGVKNAGKIAILEGGLKFKPISMPPKDLEFFQGRKLTREEILSAFKVPPILIGLLDGASYANAYQQFENFVVNVIIPKLKKIEEIFNNQLLPEFGDNLVCEFDVKQFPILQEMEHKKIDYLDKLWKIGVPFNRAIRYLGINIDPLDSVVGDKSFIANVPAELAGQQPMGGFPQFGLGQKLEPKVDTNTNVNQQTLDSLLSEMQKANKENVKKEVEKRLKHIAKKVSFVKSFNDNYDKEKINFVKKLATTFTMQKEEVISNIKNRIYKEEVDIQKAIDDIVKYTIDIDKNNKIMVEQYLGMYKDLVKKGAAAAIASFDIQLDLETIDLKTIDYLKTKVYKFAELVNGVTNEKLQNRVRETLSSALEDHLAIADIREKLIIEAGDFFDEMSIGRANNIAQTEIIGALNFGSFESYKEAGIEYKEWVDANDDKVRDTHVEADGQVVKIDEPFIVGGIELMYPGDTNGEPQEICNCRCTHVPAFLE